MFASRFGVRKALARRVKSVRRRLGRDVRHRRLVLEPLEARCLLSVLQHSGTIAADETWAAGDVHRLTGDVTVPAGVRLTIEPGTLVQSDYWRNLIVQGTLIADGAEGSPIVFTSVRDDTGLDGQLGTGDDIDTEDNGPTQGAPRDWAGIQFAASSTASALDYVEVRYAGLWAILVRGPLTMSNSLVRHSLSAGVRIETSNPTISNSAFTDNFGAAISMDLISQPIVTGLTMTGNAVNALRLDPGILPADASWDNAGVVYYLPGQVTVPVDRTLSIGPGVIVKPSAGGPFLVEGTLDARGTAAEPIIFTSPRDDTAGGDTDNSTAAPSSGDWNGLRFAATSGASVVDHVEVRYGGWGNWAAIEILGGSMTVTNSLVRNSARRGVRIDAGSPTITDSTIDNSGLAAISMGLAASPVLAGLSMTGNSTNSVVLDAGVLPADTTWGNPEVVYSVSDVTVPAGRTLSIVPGKIIKPAPSFFRKSLVVVEGTLLARGTPETPIRFTSHRDDSLGGDTNNDGAASSPAPNDWDDIHFTGSSTGSVMEHFEALYGGPPIRVSGGAGVTFSNGLISESYGGGMRIEGSSPTLTAMTIRDTRYGSAISMDLASSPRITSSIFVDNRDVDGVALDGGTLPGDIAWDNPGVVYRMASVWVPSGVTLSIAPGMTIQSPYYGSVLSVEGTLRALGSPAAPIVMEGGPEGAAELVFQPGSRGSILEHVELRNFPTSSGAAAVRVDGGELLVTDSVIRDMGRPALKAENGARLELRNSLLAGNLGHGIIVRSGATLTAVNNTIDNYGFNDYEFYGVFLTDARAMLVNNLITNLRWGIVYVGSGDLPVMRYNNVYTPGLGGSNYGGILPDQTGQNGNISADPLYVDSANGDYALRAGSPAIDSGTSDGAADYDLAFNGRHDDPATANSGAGTSPYYDMGAYEYGGRPRAVGHRTVGQFAGTVSSVILSFRDAMDTGSFLPADDVASFTGPRGPIAVQSFRWLSRYHLELGFAVQATGGDYELVLGPDILDAGGQPIDQDGDGVRGEVPDDRYPARWTIVPVPPKVVGHAPDEYLAREVDSIAFTFDKPMDPGSFSLIDEFSLTGPGGPIEPTGFIWTDSRTLVIGFPPQTALGRYEAVLGANIEDTGGNPIDQNRNGVFGEVPGDQYRGGFNLGEILYVSGAITQDTTWNGLVIVEDTVSLTSGVTLTVEPGTVVKFRDLKGIDVPEDARIVAAGSLAQPVWFTSFHDDSVAGDANRDGDATSPQAGDWRGIYVAGGQAVLDHAILTYGGGSPTGGWNYWTAPVAQYGGTITLTNSAIHDALYEGVITFGFGQATISNSLITGTDRGINVDGTVRVFNSTLDGNRIGIWGHGGTLEMVNSIVSNSLESGVYNILSTDTTIRYSDVWSPTGVNYRSLPDPTGVGGNISADPKYKDASRRNFRLGYLSPAIDAADGTAAPATDLAGAPRYDDPRSTNTGTPMPGNAAVPDMGAYEFVETADSNVDLAVTLIDGPAQAVAGGEATLRWTVRNNGTGPAVGPWHDSIYVLADNVQREVAEVLAAEVLSGQSLLGGVLGPGGSAQFETTVRVPGGTEGPWRWQVRVNSRGEVFEGRNTGNNIATTATPFQLAVPVLTAGGAPYEGTFTAAGEPAWFKLEQAAGQDLLVILDAAAATGRSRIYAGIGSMPTEASFDVRSTNWNTPDARLAVPGQATARNVYLLIVPEALDEAEKSFTLTVQTAALRLDGLDPATVANAGPVTLLLTGGGFSEGMTAQLRATGTSTTIGSTRLLIADSTTALGTFDLAGAATGDYDLVINMAGLIETLNGALRVQTGPRGLVDARAVVPKVARIGRNFQGAVQYGNDGLTDVGVPLLILESDASCPVWTPGEENTGRTSIQFLGVPQGMLTGGVLRPGQSGSFTFNTVTTDALASYDILIKDARTADPVDWAALKSDIRPEEPGPLWDLAFDAMTARIGASYGDYVGALAEAYDEMWRYGIASPLVSDILFYMIRREIELLPGSNVRGTLFLGDNNHPLPRQTILLRKPDTGEGALGLSWHDGSFALRNVPPGTYDVSVDGYIASTGQITVPSTGEVAGVDLIVSQGAQISGRVLEAGTGRPIAGAQVSARDSDTGAAYQSVTDDQGQYRLTAIAAGDVAVNVFAAAYVTPQPQYLTLAADQQASVLFELKSGGGISGQVLLPNGNTAAGASVLARQVGQSYQKVIYAGADGAYELAGLEPGTYAITADVAGYGAAVLADVAVNEGGLATASLTLVAGGAVTGTVTDANTGLPIAGASIDVKGPDIFYANVVTGADGTYTLPDLAPGPWTVSVSAEGYLTATIGATVIAGSAAAVSPTLRTAGRIEGVVKTGSGESLAGMTVTAAWGEGSRTARTNAAGAFSFLGLGDGTYVVAVGSDSNLLAAQRSFTLDVAANVFDAEFTLDVAEVSGTVLASDGSSSVQGALVGLVQGGQLIVSTQTDAAGRYRFLALRSGTADVIVSDDTLGTMRRANVLLSVGSPPVVADFTAETRTLTVNVGAPSMGEPVVAGARLLLLPTWANGLDRFGRDATTDATGAAVFNNLVPGDYQIVASDEGKATVWQTVTVGESGATASVTLQQGKVLQGTVTDGSFLAPGAVVSVVDRATGRRFLGGTRADGTYRIDTLPAGVYDVSISDGKHAPTITTDVQVTGDAPITLNAELTATGATIVGTVTDQDGRPLSGAKVAAVDAGGTTLLYTQTGTDGSYTLGPLPPGMISMRTTGDGFAPATQDVAVPASGTVTSDVNLGPSLAMAMEPPAAVPSILAAAFAPLAADASKPRNEDSVITRYADAIDIALRWRFSGYKLDDADFAFRNVTPAHECPTFLQARAAAEYTAAWMVNGFSAWEEASQAVWEVAVADLKIALARMAQIAADIAALGVDFALIELKIPAMFAKTEWDVLIKPALDSFSDLMGTAAGVLAEGKLDWPALMMNTLRALQIPLDTLFYALINTTLLSTIHDIKNLWLHLSDTVGDVQNNYKSVSELIVIVSNARDGYLSWRARHRLNLEYFTEVVAWCETCGDDDDDRPDKEPPFLRRGGGGSTGGVTGVDPNDKVTVGVGEQGWIASGQTILYTVHFENMASASAPAQEVYVTDTLDANLDWSTLELRQIGFGDVTLDVPAGLQSYTTTTSVAADPNPVRVTVSLDPATGALDWHMQSIDAVTGQFPEDPLAGFLPPNDATHRGEGFVTFVVRPKANLATGTVIRNRADIVFDVNPVIPTNEVLNTIDAGVPVSQVAGLPGEVLGNKVLVSWSGNDEGGAGSGIAGYDVYVSDNGSPYQLWLPAAQTTSELFTGEFDRTYRFYSVATDNVGHRELAPESPDAQAKLLNNPPTARPDAYSVDQDRQLTVAAAGVLDNDEDADGHAFSIVWHSDPANGTLELNPDGSFTYTPSTGYRGADTFAYKINDGRDDSQPATVTIYVNPVVQLPGGKGRNAAVVLRSGNNLKLVNNKKQVLVNQPLDSLRKLTILGAADKSDAITVGLTGGDLAALSEGIVFDGGTGMKADTLVLRGTTGSDTFRSGLGSAAVGPLVVQFADVEQVTLDGGAGDDAYQVADLSTKTTIVDSKGTDLLDFSQATVGVNVDLGKRTGQAQKIFAAGNTTLRLKGTLENVIGTEQADWIKGNAAANRIEGRGGDDWLYGDAGNDKLFGESGNNVLLGGAGTDSLDVLLNADATGRNLLIGGLGADVLQGGPGEEIFIGGTTTYDSKAAALAAVMREWASDTPSADRRINLDTGFADPLGSGFIQLRRKGKTNPKGTVLDDRVRDQFFGGEGSDWFLDFARDEVN